MAMYYAVAHVEALGLVMRCYVRPLVIQGNCYATPDMPPVFDPFIHHHIVSSTQPHSQ